MGPSANFVYKKFLNSGRAQQCRLVFSLHAALIWFRKIKSIKHSDERWKSSEWARARATDECLEEQNAAFDLCRYVSCCLCEGGGDWGRAWRAHAPSPAPAPPPSPLSMCPEDMTRQSNADWESVLVAEFANCCYLSPGARRRCT